MTRLLARLADWLRRNIAYQCECEFCRAELDGPNDAWLDVWLRRCRAAEGWCGECGKPTEDGGDTCNWCTAYLAGCQINDEPDRGDWLRA